jgi:hypothetical protein
MVLTLTWGFADGGMLVGVPTIAGPGTPHGVPSSVTVDLNNDNVGAGNPNQLTFVGVDITGFEPIDIGIQVDNSADANGDTTEYVLGLGIAVNKTNTAWSGYRVELGSGSGSEFSRLSDRAIPGVAGLDFDVPDRDPPLSSPSFPDISHTDDLIVFSGSTVSVDETASGENFSIDVPDITSGDDTSYGFTVRMQAIPVPEPYSMALWCVAVLCLSGAGMIGRGCPREPSRKKHG